MMPTPAFLYGECFARYQIMLIRMKKKEDKERKRLSSLERGVLEVGEFRRDKSIC